MTNGPPEETSELVHRLENRQRRSIMATLIGLLVAAAIAGAIVRVSYLEARKQLPAVGALSNELEQGRQELKQVRREITRAELETQRIQEELERLRKEKLRANAEVEKVQRGGAQGKLPPTSGSKPLAEMQKQVNRLQQELSATQQELKQEGQNVTALRGEADRYRKELEQGRKEIERLRSEMLRAGAGAEKVKPGRTQAKLQPASGSKQLVEMQKQVNRLQQELSATQQNLKQERQNVVVLGEETDRYRLAAAELQRRADELEKTLGERDYLRLVNEALAYTYRKGPGDEKRAETAYRNAVQLAQARNIRDPVIYSAYAVFLQEQKRFQEAEKSYKMALELNPKYGLALYNLGNLYEVRGDLKKAMEKYKAADEVGEKLGGENYLRLRSIIKQ